MAMRVLQTTIALLPLLAVAQNDSSTGVTFKTTFTWYGTNDQNGSPNCNSNTAACGFYTYPGYSAAVSQNLYGAGPGEGEGPVCGTCWRLTIDTDQNGNKLDNSGNSIVVMVNNLCPVVDPEYGQNPLCAQPNLRTANQYGGVVDFNLCNDDGAHEALFQGGPGLAVGNATQVDCSEWSGQRNTDCGSNCGSTGSTSSSGSISGSSSGSSGGQIGGNGATSSPESLGGATKSLRVCLWGLTLPLLVMLRM